MTGFTDAQLLEHLAPARTQEELAGRLREAFLPTPEPEEGEELE